MPSPANDASPWMTRAITRLRASFSAVLGACTLTGEEVTASLPNDYRQRHPTAITEADHSIVVFVGHGRAGLSTAQRADILGMARSWVREGTGAIIVDVPVDTPNQLSTTRISVVFL